jgi:hypothetical protein
VPGQVCGPEPELAVDAHCRLDPGYRWRFGAVEGDVCVRNSSRLKGVNSACESGPVCVWAGGGNIVQVCPCIQEGLMAQEGQKN